MGARIAHTYRPMSKAVYTVSYTHLQPANADLVNEDAAHERSDDVAYLQRDHKRRREDQRLGSENLHGVSLYERVVAAGECGKHAP